jgi:hypothetical protein
MHSIKPDDCTRCTDFACDNLKHTGDDNGFLVEILFANKSTFCVSGKDNYHNVQGHAQIFCGTTSEGTAAFDLTSYKRMVLQNAAVKLCGISKQKHFRMLDWMRWANLIASTIYILPLWTSSFGIT